MSDLYFVGVKYTLPYHPYHATLGSDARLEYADIGQAWLGGWSNIGLARDVKNVEAYTTKYIIKDLFDSSPSWFHVESVNGLLSDKNRKMIEDALDRERAKESLNNSL